MGWVGVGSGGVGWFFWLGMGSGLKYSNEGFTPPHPTITFLVFLIHKYRISNGPKDEKSYYDHFLQLSQKLVEGQPQNLIFCVF